MTKSSRRRVVIAVAALIGVQVAAVGIYVAVERGRTSTGGQPFRVERLSGDTAAPNIVLERQDGTRVSLHELGGDVQLVHFWATWCPPCVEELPGLMATSRAFSGRGLTLVAISMDDDWPKIRAFFDGDVPPEIFRAVDPDAHERFDIFTLPDTYLATPDHDLVFRYGGARSWRARAAREHLEAVLR